MAALNMPAQRARGAPSGKFDVFLSHAGTEKLGPIGDLHAAFSRDYPHIQCFLDCLDLQKGQPNGDDMKLYARTASAAVVYLSPAYLIRKWPFLELCIFFDERRRRLSIGDSEGPSKGGSRSAIWEGEVDPAWGDRPGSPANPMHIVPLFHGLAFEELDEFRTAVAKTGGQGIAQLEVWKRYIANHTPQDQLILQGNLDTFLRKHMQDEGKKRVWLEVVDWIKGFSGHVMNKSILEAGQKEEVVHQIAKVVGIAPRFGAVDSVFIDVKDKDGKSLYMMLKERLLSTDESAKEPVIQLMGESGLGKTTLIFRLCNDSDVREKFSKHVAYLNLAELEKSKEDVQDKAIEKFYQQLAEKLTGAKFAKSSRAQCISQFDALCDKHREKPLLIALDNVVHKSTYTESFPFRRLPPGSVVLISSSGPLRRTSRGDTEIKAWEKGALRLGPWTIGERAALLAWHLLERPIEQLGEGERQRVTALGKACSDGNPSSLVVRAPGLKQRLEAAAASKDGGLDAAWESIIEEWTDSEDLFLDTGLSKVEAAYKVLYDGLHEAEQIMLVDLLLFGRNMGSPLVGPVPVPKDAALQMWGVSESRGLSWGLQRANVRLEKLISLGLVACERRPYVSALHGQEAVGDILTIQASLQSLLQRVVVEGVALEEQHQLLGILPELPTQLPQVLPKARKFFGPNAGFRGPSYASKLLSKMDGLQCLSLAFTYSYLSEEGVPSLPFPPPFGHLGRLLHLNLSGCRIGEVPRDVFSLPCLRALVLQNCTVDAPGCFPEEVGGLGSLEVLDLSFSQGLVRLPGALAGLKQLDTLIVRGCCDLKHIPDLRDNVKRVDARGCTSLREFPENNLSLLVPAKVGAWRVQRVTWLRWEYETDEGDEFKEETGDAAAYADRRGWSFCVEKLRAMLQRGYEYSAKFGRGAFGTAGSLFRWPSDNERRAFEAVLDVLCSARHDPDAEGESVLTDAAREGALDALGRVAASSWLNLELRAKALKALERQVSADAGQALSYSIAHRPREIESKEGKSFGEGNWRGSEEESDTGESDDERGGSSEDDSEGSEEGSEDPPEETGEMKAKAELLPHLLRLWAEERRRKSKSPGRHMLLDSVWKVVSAMRSACAAGSSRNGGVRWRVLWLSAVLAIQHQAVLPSPMSEPSRAITAKRPGEWLSSITDKLLRALDSVGPASRTKQNPWGLETAVVATEEAVAGHVLGVCLNFPLHEDSVYHWGDVLEAAYHRLGGRRVKLLVLDPPSLGALEWPAGLAGHLIVPWDRQEEMASLLGTRYGKTHPIRVVTELYDGATELTDPLVFVDGDSGEVIQQYGFSMLHQLEMISRPLQYAFAELHPFTSEHLLAIAAEVEDLKWAMDVSIKGVNEEVALFLATLDLIREKHDGPESLARSGDWEFVQESMATLRSTIARVQSKYTRSDTSVRLGDSLPSTYIPAVKAHRIAHLFFAPEAPSFARVEQLDEEEHRFGVSFILVQLNGSMDLVLNLALELPPGGYTLAWRLAPMEVAVGGFKSATTFAASVRQHNETRELPPRVVNFGRVRDCPEIPEEAGTQKGSRGWYEMEVADFEVRAPRAAAARAEGRTSVEVECRISDEVMAAQGYRFPKQRLDLDALVIRPSDNGARRVWWMCDEPFPIKDPEAPVKRRALPWDQDLLAFLEDTWHLSEPALRDVVSSGLQRAHIPFLKGTAQWDSWFSTLGDNAVACKWAEEQLAAGATLTGSFGTGPEDWTCLSGSVRGELEREGIDSVAKLAFLTDAQLRRLGMEESERVLVAQLRKEVQEGARERGTAKGHQKRNGGELLTERVSNVDTAQSPLARMLAGWGVPPEKIAALLAEGWTPEDLPPMVGTKWWRLLLPDEARRTDAAAALARARGSVPSDDEREEELSEEGTDTGGIAEKQASSEEMSDGESQNVGAESPAQEKGLLLPDEARRTKAAAARARARGSAPSGDEREEELSEDGTDTGGIAEEQASSEEMSEVEPQDEEEKSPA